MSGRRRSRRRDGPGRAGFTLVELLVVAIVMALLAVSALPAFDRVAAARRAAAANQVERLLTVARAAAMATGQPIGVRIDPGAGEGGTLSLIRYDTQSGDVGPFIGYDGSPHAGSDIGIEFPGVRIVGVTHGDGSSGAGVIWFGQGGTPHLRDEDGTYTGGFVVDAVIVVTGDEAVTVTRQSGMIER